MKFSQSRVKYELHLNFGTPWISTGILSSGTMKFVRIDSELTTG